MISHEIDGGEQLGQPFKCVVLTLQRDEHRIGGRERIHGQEAERWRTVDEDHVVASGDGFEQPPKPTFACIDPGQFHLGTGQRDRCRDDVDAHGRALDDQRTEIVPVHDGVVDGSVQ